MRVHEVGVLRNDNSLLQIGDVADLFISGPVGIGQVERVFGIATDGREPARHPSRELSVHEEVHGISAWRRCVLANLAA